MRAFAWISLLAGLSLGPAAAEAVKPTSDRLEAAKRLQSGPGTWSVEWDTRTGAPSAIEGRERRPVGQRISLDDAERLARAWLWDHAALFGLRAGRDDFRLLSNIAKAGEFEITLGQLYEGIVVPTALSVCIDSRGRFRRYRGCFFPGLDVALRPELSEEEAIRIAWEDRKGAGAKLPALTSLLVQTPPDARVTWTVHFSRSVDWHVTIDAVTGQILSRSMMGAYR